MERDEQIKQNAHNYTNTNDHNWVWDDSGENRVDISEEISEAYIQGAHSRDDEIKHITRIATTYKSDAQDTVAECERLHDIIDKLSNPWISVEDRLPDREETLTRFSKYVLCALDNGECYITDYFDYERNRWNSFPNSITHWMPIPKLEKGGKE